LGRVFQREKLQFPASLFYVRALCEILKKGPVKAAAVKSTKKETSDENIFTPLSLSLLRDYEWKNETFVFFSLYSRAKAPPKNVDESHWGFALFFNYAPPKWLSAERSL